MIQLTRTNSDHPDFAALVRELDADLAERDGSDHSFYAQFNKTSKLGFVVVAHKSGIPVGCGAIREYDPVTMEVKRMYVVPEERGKGIAGTILDELEKWAGELSISRFVLETGKRQPEAIQLYTRQGYRRIANYGQYIGIDNSVCFEKLLK